MINILPMGGLCNRLRMIESAIALGKACSKDVVCWWSVSAFEMNDRFSALFESIPGMSVREFEEHGIYSRWLFSRFNPYRYREQESESFAEACLKNGVKLTSALNGCEAFFKSHTPDYSWLKPKPEIQSRIEEEMLRVGVGVGVHVRRTDNKIASEASPLGLYVEAMDREISTNAQTRFFLASDDPTVKSELSFRFPGRIFTRESILRREDSGGIVDAVIDLMVLSNQKKILGSYWSSFSGVAALIGKIPIEVVCAKR